MKSCHSVSPPSCPRGGICCSIRCRRATRRPGRPFTRATAWLTRWRAPAPVAPPSTPTTPSSAPAATSSPRSDWPWESRPAGDNGCPGAHRRESATRSSHTPRPASPDSPGDPGRRSRSPRPALPRALTRSIAPGYSMRNGCAMARTVPQENRARSSHKQELKDRPVFESGISR